jgi:hypothetical protein
MGDLRCEVTGNIVGTDTRPIGSPCKCAACKSDRLITELVAALKATQVSIINCRDKAAFSSKDTIVKYLAERLPSIDAVLARARDKNPSYLKKSP